MELESRIKLSAVGIFVVFAHLQFTCCYPMPMHDHGRHHRKKPLHETEPFDSLSASGFEKGDFMGSANSDLREVDALMAHVAKEQAEIEADIKLAEAAKSNSTTVTNTTNGATVITTKISKRSPEESEMLAEDFSVVQFQKLDKHRFRTSDKEIYLNRDLEFADQQWPNNEFDIAESERQIRAKMRELKSSEARLHETIARYRNSNAVLSRNNQFENLIKKAENSIRQTTLDIETLSKCLELYSECLNSNRNPTALCHRILNSNSCGNMPGFTAVEM